MALLAPLLAMSLLAGCGDDPGNDAGTSKPAADDSGCAQVEAPAPKDDGGATEPTT